MAWKLIKVMQQTLQKEIYEAEAVYLRLHLQRIQAKVKNNQILFVKSKSSMLGCIYKVIGFVMK